MSRRKRRFMGWGFYLSSVGLGECFYAQEIKLKHRLEVVAKRLKSEVSENQQQDFDSLQVRASEHSQIGKVSLRSAHLFML